MKKTFLFLKNGYWEDKKIFLFLSAGVLLNLFFWLAVWRMTSFFEGQIPLHYNIYFGVDLLGDKKEIFKLPSTGAIFFLLNFALSFFLYERERILSYFLIIAGFFVQIFLFASALLIISL